MFILFFNSSCRYSKSPDLESLSRRPQTTVI